MTKKYRRTPSQSKPKAATSTESEVSIAGGDVQLRLPIAEILAAAQESLDCAMGEIGLLVMNGLIEDEVSRLVGERHQRQDERQAYRWGRQRGYVTFAGQKLPLERPRVRSTEGKEVQLERYELFQDDSRLQQSVVGRVMSRVSTRDYEGTIDEFCEGYGVKKSSVSRQWKAASSKELQRLMERSLEDLDLFAVMIDGIHLGEYTVVAALGFATDGSKHMLGLWQGATENATLCKALLTDLRDRGLTTDRHTLFVLDGSKALHKGVVEVYGQHAIIQRCQQHKRENVLSYLPKSCQGIVKQKLTVAWGLTSYSEAKKSLLKTIEYLESISHSAANSLREGLEETLTLHRLQASPGLRRLFSTTNSIESCFSRSRDLLRNVKTWRSGEMATRWAGAVFLKAEAKFRRVRSFRDIPLLAASLWKEVDAQSEVA